MTSPGELLLKQKYKKMLGLENIDNIADINKVLSISQISNLQTSLDSKLNNTNMLYTIIFIYNKIKNYKLYLF